MATRAMVTMIRRLSCRIARKLPVPGGRIWRAFHIGVLSYSIFLMLMGTVLVTGIVVTRSIAKAQSLQDRVDAARQQAVMSGQVTELEKRLTAIEQLNLDRRLTVIETLLKEVNSQTVWGPLSMGGVGLLIFREAYLSLSKKRRSREEEE